MGTTWEVDWRLLAAVIFGLVCFGIAFNTLVDWLAARKEGYTSLLVVGGVLVTLAGVAIIDFHAAFLCTIAFVASGLPMVLGDIARAVKMRERAIDRMKKEIVNANVTNDANDTNRPLNCWVPERESDDPT